MFILTGASGTGKTTIERLLQQYGLKRVISYTTRQPRDGEVNGVDYHYVTEEDFLAKVDSGFFAENVTYNGNRYGMAVEDCSDDKIVVVEPDGLRQIKALEGLNVKAIYLDSNDEQRAMRMLQRGDKFDSVKKRIENDRVVFNQDVKDLCDVVIDANPIIEYVFYTVKQEVFGKAE